MEVRAEYARVGGSPLEFAWTYNSNGAPANAIFSDLIVGPRRSHTYLRRITTYTQPEVAAYLARPDGRALLYRKVGDAWVVAANFKEKLVEIKNNGVTVGWRVEDGQGGIEYYDAKGKLQDLEDASGRKQHLTYGTDGRLQQVDDDFGRALKFVYDYKGRLATLTTPDGKAIAFSYAYYGELARVDYPDGAYRQYLYNESGYVNYTAREALTGVLDENQVRIDTTKYDSQSRAYSVSGAGGVDAHSATYQGDGVRTINAVVTFPSGAAKSIATSVVAGRVVPTTSTTSCTGCVPSTANYTYDANGNLNVLTLNGVATDYDYDARGLLTQQIDAANDSSGKKRIAQTDWHSTLPVPVERRIYDASNALVAKQAWTYNARGQALTFTSIDPATNATRTTTTTYCEQADITAGTCPLLGLVTSINGPRIDVNDITTYTYYPSEDATCASAPTTCPHRKGDLWLVQDAVGNITDTLKYDGAGRVLSVKDANGAVTDFEYHARGWLTARKVRGTDNASEADDQITRIDYTPTGLVQKTTLPDGSFTTYTYDAAHRLTDIADGEGNKLHYTLDNAGNRTKEEALGTTGTVLRTLSRVYNQLGQVKTHKDAYDHGTGYVYDANGNTDTVTDALSRGTDNDYDPLNRLTKTIQNVGGLNVTTQFKYDAQDHLTEVVDPKNLSTKYTYNGLGDLKQLDSPDTGVTGYTYDSAGNRKTQTDARNVTTTYGYDALNRLTSVSYPDSSLNVGYSYDTAATACTSGETFAAGRLSLITDGSGSTQYCYDRFGQMVRKVQTTAGQSLTVRYGYTKAGQLSSVTYPDGTVADYVRDALGRATEIGVTNPGQSRSVLLTSAAYYPFGPVAQWVFGNGRSFQRTLNQNYQSNTVKDASAGGLSLGYEFDAVGNLIKLRDGSQSDPPLRRYAYDALNRLTEAREGTTDALLEAYSYDATGNRLSATDDGVTQGHTISTTSHRLMDVGGVARVYDNAGNTLSIGNRGFAFNEAGRMGQAANGSVTISYAYNGTGEQVRRSTGTASTTTVYDEAGHSLGEYDAAGTPTQQVVWLGDLPVGVLAPSASGSSAMNYIEADALGTPRAIVHEARNVAVWSWPLTGEAFGKDQANDDPDSDGTSFSFSLRFAGQRFDPDTQLNYNYFRDYDPAVGRYTESDPIGLGGGASTFGYANQNSLIYADPTGEIAPIAGPLVCASGVCEALAATAVATIASLQAARDSGGPLVGTFPWLVDYTLKRWDDMGVSGLVQMASHGNQADTGIVNDYGRAASDARLKGCPPPDRCEWLKANASRYTPAQVKATEKAWGCRGSRHSKGGKAR